MNLFFSCKEKYKRPDYFNIDLFENERIIESKNKILSSKEALELSKFLIISDSIQLLDSSIKQNRKSIYVYKVYRGKIDKGNKDSIHFPINIFSEREIQLDSKPYFLYLNNLKYFKLLVKDFNIKYQTVSNSPFNVDNK